MKSKSGLKFVELLYHRVKQYNFLSYCFILLKMPFYTFLSLHFDIYASMRRNAELRLNA